MKKKFLSAILAVGVCLQGTVLSCCANNSTGNTTWANSTCTENNYTEAELLLQAARGRVERCIGLNSLLKWFSRLGAVSAGPLGWWMSTPVARHLGKLATEATKTACNFAAGVGDRLFSAMTSYRLQEQSFQDSVKELVKNYATPETQGVLDTVLQNCQSGVHITESEFPSVQTLFENLIKGLKPVSQKLSDSIKSFASSTSAEAQKNAATKQRQLNSIGLVIAWATYIAAALETGIWGSGFDWTASA